MLLLKLGLYWLNCLLFNTSILFYFCRLEFEARNFNKEAKELAIIEQIEKIKLESC